MIIVNNTLDCKFGFCYLQEVYNTSGLLRNDIQAYTIFDTIYYYYFVAHKGKKYFVMPKLPFPLENTKILDIACNCISVLLLIGDYYVVWIKGTLFYPFKDNLF